MRKLILLNGTILANDYIRVVHGGRGDYVEFSYDQLAIPLYYKFGQRGGTVFDPAAPNQQRHMKDIRDFDNAFYVWLLPKGMPDVKVYFQLKTVNYADYRIGKMYIAPNLLKGEVV